MVGEVLLTSAALTVAYVGLHTSAHDPGRPASRVTSGPAQPGASVASVRSSVVASRLRTGMVVDYHGRRWTIVRASRVATHPGLLLELHEAGMPGFHVVYVDPASPVVVVGRV